MTSVPASRLVDETLGLLQSFTQDTEQVTTLAGSMLATDYAGSVTTVQNGILGLSPGVVEIDAELMYCDTVGADGSFTVAAWGRGYDNTTAAPHSAGARVRSQPSFPRFWVMEALNETISRVFPDIFVATTQTFTTTYPVITYDLPDTAEFILDAKWQLPDARRYWKEVRRWRISNGGSTVSGDPGVSIDIADVMIPGRPLEVTFAAPPSKLTSETDDFTGVTGLDIGMRDVIVLGAAAQLTMSMELSRLQLFSIEQEDRARLVAPSAALTSSRFLEQKFQTRLAEERKTLRRKWKPRLVREWV